LGKTLGEVEAMPVAELALWAAYFKDRERRMKTHG
jgi:hypothetical protein